MRYWQDLQPGESFTTTSLTVSLEDILEFAAEFDPQPYHLDNRAARESIFGGLCASGWQVTALMMRLITDALQAGAVPTLGSSGVDRLRWKMPVFAGDALTARLTINACRPAEQAGFGELDCSVVVKNQNDNPVLEASVRMLAASADTRTGKAAYFHG